MLVAFPLTISTRPRGIRLPSNSRPSDSTWRFVVFGPEHDTDYWTRILIEIRSISPNVNASIEEDVSEYSNIQVLQISAFNFLKTTEVLH